MLSKDHITCAGPPPSWASCPTLQPDAGPCWARGTRTVILEPFGRHRYLICPRIGVARTHGIRGKILCLALAYQQPCAEDPYSTAPSFCRYHHVILLPLVTFTSATVHHIQRSCKLHKLDICLVIASACRKLGGETPLCTIVHILTTQS